ncbi:MAG TPA: hypothetical protein PLN71_13925 [Anaerolineae bacterium]|nr:hypothetical protein [Anaerolineae bacterium]
MTEKPKSNCGEVAEIEQINNALDSLKIIASPHLQKMFEFLPIAIVVGTTIIVFARWYSQYTLDLPRLSGGLALLVCLLFVRELFYRFPQTLFTIWRRQVLQPRTVGRSELSSSPYGETTTQFLNFIRENQRRFDSRYSIAFGVVGMLVVFWLIWLLDYDRLMRFPENLRNALIPTGISTIVRIIYLAGGYIGGLVGWRVIAIAKGISTIGNGFDINLQLGHPDKCGGLRPLGDLCLLMAYILSPLLLVIGLGLTFVSTLDPVQVGIPPANIQRLASTLQGLLIPLVLLSLISFIRPLVSIHRAMVRAKLRLEGELDSISQQMHQLNAYLLTRATELPIEEVEHLEKKVDFLQRAYTRNSQIPTWPFDLSHIWRLATTQIAPVIGLGTSSVEILRGFIQNLLRLLR